MDARLPDAAFGSKFAFEVTPKALQAVDVVPVRHIVALAVFHKAVDVALGGDTCIAAPIVRKNCGTFLDLFENTWLELLGFNRVDQLGPDFTFTAQNAKNGLFAGAPATFCLRLAVFNRKSFIFPLATQVGLIDLNGALESLREILSHCNAQQSQDFQ